MAEFRQAKHTIILVQYTRDPNSRTYLDFESVNGGMDGVVKMYEAKLKQLNPNLKNITYDIQDLYTYIDSLTDLSALVLDLETKTYLPCDREEEWMVLCFGQETTVVEELVAEPH
ncbi:unnamed protein product [Peronospora belbahrii]|uniref:Enhancer of rudimentary homolog n=1 Tax=Peronospora belbahrii TaxID=622444 RepID=A0AAU9KZ86_9STRA|nr:unnamed protein product [Peronospora belbahrii]